jgi:hypothetical protein
MLLPRDLRYHLAEAGETTKKRTKRCRYASTWRTHPLPPRWTLIPQETDPTDLASTGQRGVRRVASPALALAADGPPPPKRIRLTLSGREVRLPTRYGAAVLPEDEILSADEQVHSADELRSADVRDETSIEDELLSELIGFSQAAPEAATAAVANEGGSVEDEDEDLLIVASQAPSPEPPPSTARSGSTPTMRTACATKDTPGGVKRRARRPVAADPSQLRRTSGGPGAPSSTKSAIAVQQARSSGGSFVRTSAPLRPSGSRPGGAGAEEIVDARLRERFLAASRGASRTDPPRPRLLDHAPSSEVPRRTATPTVVPAAAEVELSPRSPVVGQRAPPARPPRSPSPVRSPPLRVFPRPPSRLEPTIAAPPPVSSLVKTLTEEGTSSWSEADLPPNCFLVAPADYAVRNAARHAFKANKVAELGNALCRVRRYRWSAAGFTLDWVRDDRQGTWTRSYPLEIAQAGTADDYVRFLEAEEAAVEAKGWSIIAAGELDDRSGISISWERLPQLGPPPPTVISALDPAPAPPAPASALSPSPPPAAAAPLAVAASAAAAPQPRLSATPSRQPSGDERRPPSFRQASSAVPDVSSMSGSVQAIGRPPSSEPEPTCGPSLQQSPVPVVAPSPALQMRQAAATAFVKNEPHELEFDDVLLDPSLFEIDPGLFLDVAFLPKLPAPATEASPALAPPAALAAESLDPALVVSAPFPLQANYDDVLEQLKALLGPLESAYAGEDNRSAADCRNAIESALAATEALRESLASQIAGPLRRQRRLVGVAVGSSSG